MKERVYRLLVSRVPGIRDRYLQFRRQKKGSRRQALFYLLWLNVQYYLFFRRSLLQPQRYPYYEQISLYRPGPESSLSRRESPQEFAARLAAYDVVSFDVFDTLLFRCFSDPTDLFHLVGMTLQYPDFKRLRREAEEHARLRKERTAGTREVTLSEIWEELAPLTGVSKETGMQAEWEWERRCCFANPYMAQVIAELRAMGKTPVALSDMYLGREQIQALLEGCGLGSFPVCLVSGDSGVSKSDGGLYRLLRRMGEGRTYVHVGDHPHSDCRQALRHGVQGVLYPNVNHRGNRYRAMDLSALTGSFYRGLVNARIHSGQSALSREYEFGFVYGGLFLVGYCRFLNACRRTHSFDKLLFLSRDGFLLQKAYCRMYPEEADTAVYAYWSRLAAVKLTAGCYPSEYFERFVDHKADCRLTLRQVLQSMELPHLLAPLCAQIHAAPDTQLTNKNRADVKSYFMEVFEDILAHYQEQQAAAKAYYQSLLNGCKSVAAVDIGWAGSGAVMLNCAVNRIWGLGCAVTGILAGTNTAASPQADAAEPFFLSGRLISYLYSQRENRDLWKFHDPAQNHNLYWELLLGAPQGSLIGFYPAPRGGVACRFKEPHADPGRIREIHRGALDFVDRFLQAEGRLGIPIPVSGRDAYAPMLLACSQKNRAYMESLEELLDEISIG